MTTVKQATKKEEIVNTNEVKKVGISAEETQKSNILATIEKFRPEAPRTAEERILLSKEFEALSTRYSALKEKDQDLKTFRAGNDKTNAKIIFKNSLGFEFEVRNSNIVNRLTEEAQKELKILLDEANNEIMTFQM